MCLLFILLYYYSMCLLFILLYYYSMCLLFILLYYYSMCLLFILLYYYSMCLLFILLYYYSMCLLFILLYYYSMCFVLDLWKIKVCFWFFSCFKWALTNYAKYSNLMKMKLISNSLTPILQSLHFRWKEIILINNRIVNDLFVKSIKRACSEQL